jgi:hypothetical protein
MNDDLHITLDDPVIEVASEPEAFVFIGEIDGEDKELITMSERGIEFHRGNFKNWTPDDFAEEVMSILESGYHIKFCRNGNH